ncbi:MAG: hypothetical protein ABIS14_06610 [Sphingomonas sp.]
MGLLRLRRIGLFALSLTMTACALHTAKPPIVGFIPIPRSFEARRAILIGNVRTDLRRQSPTFDDEILERVLAVMRQIPREDFLSQDARDLAYLDSPLPIGFGQTISDPHIVAVMTAAVRLPAHASRPLLKQALDGRCWGGGRDRGHAIRSHNPSGCASGATVGANAPPLSHLDGVSGLCAMLVDATDREAFENGGGAGLSSHRLPDQFPAPCKRAPKDP